MGTSVRDERGKDRTIRISHQWWPGSDSQRIFSLTHDPQGGAFGSVLILPPFGLCAADLLMPAFYSAAAGARAVRFDGRNNVGLSPGEIYDFRLGVVLEDARFAAEQLVRSTGRDDFLIYGMSLTASVALLLARDYPRARAVLFVPVVDVCRTIDSAADNGAVIDIYRRREPGSPKSQKIFGHDVHGQPFFDDLLESGLATVEGVLAAAAAVHGRADLVLAAEDQFSSAQDRQRLIEALGAEQHALVLDDANHDFGRSPLTRKRAFARLVEVAQTHFGVPQERRCTELPSDPDLVAAARAERALLRSLAEGVDIAA